jgi:hypothetical protein
MNIVSDKELLMSKLIQFYDKKANIDRIIPILTRKSNISLRLIDHFVTTYSSKKNIHYYIDNKLFIVGDEYSKQVDSYSKCNFDPFCRGETNKIWLQYDDISGIQTTVGQLCFFRWAIKNKVLDYIKDNYIDIKLSISEKLKTKKITTKKILTKYNAKFTITFND